MGKKTHLLHIFKDNPKMAELSHVQVKPKKSKRWITIQIEIKIPDPGHFGLSRLHLGNNVRTLTEAILRSNFGSAILHRLKEIKVHDPIRLLDTLKNLGDPLAQKPAFEVEHVSGAEENPLAFVIKHRDALKVTKEQMQLLKGDMPISKETVDSWRWKLMYSRQLVKEARSKIETFCDIYVELLRERNRELIGGKKRDGFETDDPFADPPAWLKPILNYVDAYVPEPPKPKADPPSPPEKAQRIFAPFLTASGGGPNMMPLLYHQYYERRELLSPCFFNKNFSQCSKVHKDEMSQVPIRDPAMQVLSWVHIKGNANHNYNGGTLHEDYLRYQNLRVEYWVYDHSVFLHTLAAASSTAAEAPTSTNGQEGAADAAVPTMVGEDAAKHTVDGGDAAIATMDGEDAAVHTMDGEDAATAIMDGEDAAIAITDGEDAAISEGSSMDSFAADLEEFLDADKT